MTVLSLFDGISCARVALERLGYTDILYLASEVDKYAIQIAQKNYPDTIQLGDVCKIQRDMLPAHIDLLIGGSPCQDLSIAKNNRKGLDGERSGLFWEWVRLWKECQPKYWVLENVNSMPKEAKRIISETLGVEPIMINAALVSAQSRKRLFWTNIATDMFGNCHIPQPEDRGILLKDVLDSGVGVNDKSYTLDSNYWRTPGAGKAGTGGTQAARRKQVIDTPDKSFCIGNTNPSGRGMNGNVYDVNAKSPNLTTNKGEGNKIAEPIRVGEIESKNGLPHIQGNRIYSGEGKSIALSSQSGGIGSNTGLYAIAEPVAIPEATKQGYVSKTGVVNEIVGNKLINSSGKTHQQDLLQGIEGKCRAIPAGTHGSTPHLLKTVMQDYTIRKLTPVECERLMTLEPIVNKYELRINKEERCLDHQSKVVRYAEVKCHRLLKLVGNAESEEELKLVPYVEKCIHISYQRIKKRVQPVAHLNLEALERLNAYLKGMSKTALLADKSIGCHHPKSIADFALLLVGMTMLLVNSQQHGKAESPQKEANSLQQMSGKNVLLLCGRGITQPVSDVWENTPTIKKLTKYIISARLLRLLTEQEWTTLYCCVTNAINGFIQTQMPAVSISSIQIETYEGFTYGISNTQRYKCLGNSFVCEVIVHILSFMDK